MGTDVMRHRLLKHERMNKTVGSCFDVMIDSQDRLETRVCSDYLMDNLVWYSIVCNDDSSNSNGNYLFDHFQI
jgi:hypothetical protein